MTGCFDNGADSAAVHSTRLLCGSLCWGSSTPSSVTGQSRRWAEGSPDPLAAVGSDAVTQSVKGAGQSLPDIAEVRV